MRQHQVEGLGDFADAEHLDGVTATVDEARGAERGFIDGGTGVKQIVEFAHIEDPHLVAEIVIVETPFGQAAVEWHLATFKAHAGSAAGTRLLAFVSFAGGLAVTGAFAATQPFVTVFGTRIGAVGVEVHGSDQFFVRSIEGGIETQDTRLEDSRKEEEELKHGPWDLVLRLVS